MDIIMFIVLITIVPLGNGGASPVATWNDNGKTRKGHRKDYTLLPIHASFGSFQRTQPLSMPMGAIVPPVTRTGLVGFAILRGVASLSVLISEPNPYTLIGMNGISYMNSALGMTSSLGNAVTMGTSRFDVGPFICGVLSDYATETKHIISIAKEGNKTSVVVD